MERLKGILSSQPVLKFFDPTKSVGLVCTSSPRYPQSNGMSERAIQTIKNLLRKAFEDGNDPYIALVECRNTAFSGLKESPAQLLTSRMLKSKLPTSASLLKLRVLAKAQEKLRERNDRQKMYYDWNAKPLPQIKEDDTVQIRKGKTWEPAIVSEKHTAPRSFIVITLVGFAYRRNRRHLLPTNEAPPVITGLACGSNRCNRVIIPAVVITPPVAASNAELPAAGSTNCRSDLQTPTKCTSIGRTVRLPARFRQDYIMN